MYSYLGVIYLMRSKAHICKDIFHYNLAHTPCPSDLKVSDCLVERTGISVTGPACQYWQLVSTRLLHQPSEPQSLIRSPELLGSAPSSPQTASSTRAGNICLALSVPSALLPAGHADYVH